MARFRIVQIRPGVQYKMVYKPSLEAAERFAARAFVDEEEYARPDYVEIDMQAFIDARKVWVYVRTITNPQPRKWAKLPPPRSVHGIRSRVNPALVAEATNAAPAQGVNACDKKISAPPKKARKTIRQIKLEEKQVRQARLKEIEDRLAAATTGPWEVVTYEGHDPQPGADWVGAIGSPASIPQGNELHYLPYAGSFSFNALPLRADAEFMAEARQDIPWLLEQLAAAESTALTAEMRLVDLRMRLGDMASE